MPQEIEIYQRLVDNGVEPDLASHLAEEEYKANEKKCTCFCSNNYKCTCHQKPETTEFTMYACCTKCLRPFRQSKIEEIDKEKFPKVTGNVDNLIILSSKINQLIKAHNEANS